VFFFNSACRGRTWDVRIFCRRSSAETLCVKGGCRRFDALRR
jgi:hypothetical protein